jgi:GNAT superfamily N-acetyltransferase
MRRAKAAGSRSTEVLTPRSCLVGTTFLAPELPAYAARVNPAAPFPRLTGTADVSVRPARPEDAADVARVQVVTWRTAYRAVLPAAVLDDWDADAATAAWRRAVESPPTPGHGVLVALEGQTVVGFAAFGTAELTGDEEPHPAGPTSELTTLLVEPRWGRRGHGSRLLAAVTDLARSGGTARLQTWLLEADRVSAGFYEATGWAPDGWARRLETGGETLREIRWHTLLDDDAAGAR